MATRKVDTLQSQLMIPRADMCLIFPYKTTALVRWGDASEEEAIRGLRPPTDQERHTMETWQLRRQGVITALSDAGFILSMYYSRDRDEIFVKVAGEDQHLRRVAEAKRHKLEMKEEYLSAFAQFQEDIVGTKELGFSDRVITSHLYKPHIDLTDEEHGDAYPKPNAIFRTTDRIQLIQYAVTQSDNGCAGIDVGQLIHDGELRQFFALHENKKLLDMDRDWFKCFVWGTDIHKVRDYFGERIAMYFLFMSHLVRWLILPGIVGVGLWSAGVFYGSPDNYTALIICVGMSFWSVGFIHFWRRCACQYAMKWGTLGLTRSMEPARPGFRGTSRINPVTGRIDRYYPWSERIFSVVFSYTCLLFSVFLLAFVISLLFYLRHVFHKNGGRNWFMVVNAIVVSINNNVFTWIAKKLTIRENHRTYSEHSNHLLAKTIVFKFINSYISLYFIAFVKDHVVLFGTPMSCMYNERLERTDCLRDLGWQLGIFVGVRFLGQTLWQTTVPYFETWFKRFEEGRQFNTGLFGMTKSTTVMVDMSTAEKQAIKNEYDVFEDMDDILILYGYSTLFVVACPWVPMVCLCVVVFELFLDQKKLVLLYKRPVPQPAANNEPWDTAFDVFGVLAMLTNAAVIIWGGHSFDNWTHMEKLLLFFVIEFATVFARIMIGVILPTEPRRVRLLELQQREMVHRHLNLGGEEDDHETRANAMRSTAQPAPYVYDRDQEDDDGY
jgi:hypothetical protein